MKQIKPAAAFALYYPLPTALVTSVDADGCDNLLTVGWFMRVSIDPVMAAISIGTERHSHNNILQSREFALCQPATSQAKQTWYCGTHSGRDEDKFAATGLEKIPATEIRPVLVADCAVAYECRVCNVVETGDHTLFIADVVAAHVDEAKLPLLFDFGSGVLKGIEE